MRRRRRAVRLAPSMRASCVVKGEPVSGCCAIAVLCVCSHHCERVESVSRRGGPHARRLPAVFRQTSHRHGVAVLLCVPAVAFAQQSPWERAATNLEATFTGPLARSLALVAIVIGGLMFMYGEAGAKRQISGIVFGGGLALFAAQFLVWLF